MHFRGTDYRRQYNNHPVFITINQEIEKVKETFEAGNYEVIFLATDEQEAVEAFKREFGSGLKYFDDTWRADRGIQTVLNLLNMVLIRLQYMGCSCNAIHIRNRGKII